MLIWIAHNFFSIYLNKQIWFSVALFYSLAKLGLLFMLLEFHPIEISLFCDSHFLFFSIIYLCQDLEHIRCNAKLQAFHKKIAIVNPCWGDRKFSK